MRQEPGRYDARDAGDGFGVVRIVAALMVIFAHAFPLAGTPEPIWQRGSVHIGFGSAAVDIFFVVSGYLVFSSWLRDPSPGRFVARRVARIWPGLVVMLVMTTLLMGPLISTVPVSRYLASPVTWTYLVGSICMMPVWGLTLPGVFDTNLFHGMNGSLWTLPIEVTAYAGVLVVGQLLRVRNWRALALLVGAPAVAIAAVGLTLGMMGRPVLTNFSDWLDQPFFIFFACGAVFYAGRNVVPLRWWIFTGALVALGLALAAGWLIPVFPLLAYGVVFVSTRQGGLLRRLTAWGDPSYGIYIYAYPIQQLLVHWRLADNGWLLFVEASVISIGIGYLSWHLVEAKALAYARRRLARRSRPQSSRLVAAA